MLPFSLGFICLLGGHLPHIACKPSCLFVLDLQRLPISHRVKTQELYMAHRAPQFPFMSLAASPTTPLPLLALFQSHCPPHSSLAHELHFSQGLASLCSLCPDFTPPRYLLTPSAPSGLCSIPTFTSLLPHPTKK